MWGIWIHYHSAGIRMKETDPYDHKIVIIQCHNVNEPQVSRLAICNPPLALAYTTICVRCPEPGFFSHFPCWKRCLSAGKKSASLPVGQNEKVSHQRNKFPSRFAQWCFQKLLSFTSIVPSQLLVFLCRRRSACLDWLRVGSRCWLHDRSVSATCFDKNRLFPAGFWRVFLCFSFFLFSFSLALSPSSASEHAFWKDVPSSFLDVVLFSAHFEAFFKTLSFTWLGIPLIQFFLCWLISMEENSAFLPIKQEYGDMQSLFNVALPPETK